MRTSSVVLAVASVVGLFFVGSVEAARDEGGRGNSNVIQLNLELWDADAEAVYPDAWGVVTAKVNEDGTANIVLNAKNLAPETTYQIKSGGSEVGTGTTNKGGNLHVQLRDIETGARINVWDGTLRVLVTGDEL
jgi:hypothetical protein